MTRVVYVHTTPYPEAIAALAPYRPQMAHTPPGDPLAYFGILTDLWRAGEPFTLVEQDIVVYPGAIEHMAVCEHDWCGTAYYINGAYGIAHGCTTYKAPIMDRLRNLPDRIPPDRRGWLTLDSHWFYALNAAGERPATHWPAVRHLHQYPMVGEFNCDACGQAIPDELVQEFGPEVRCPRCEGVGWIQVSRRVRRPDRRSVHET